uniref:45 kDa calcium-binding protein n=1 Tax=Phallusia mammillata TaxID=59560 RepID=A0A6F9DSG7_9ASCI|nr:45 kDa calcium-binding protein-like [Phallusia mammillata]
MLPKLLLFVLITFTIVGTSYGKSLMMMVKNESKDGDANPNEEDDAAKKIKTEIEDDLAPPKHLDAVKIGRDGNLNSNFHKEVFLGEDLDNFENGNYELKDQKSKLEEIFHLIDTNKDKHLDNSELTAWVLSKTREHFEEAKRGNAQQFAKIDTDGDNQITWNEYLAEFLAQRNFDKKSVAEKLKNSEKIEISKDVEDEVEDARDKWMQSASEGETDFLTSEQFLDFQHPETSKGMLQYLVEDFLHDMDIDGDGELSIHEYMSVGSDVDVDTQADEWAQIRKKEFRNVMDVNHDNKVTKDELEKYLDPLSENMAEQEARQLIAFGDDDGDDKLSLDELLENSEFYTGSKLYNYAKSVHDDL